MTDTAHSYRGQPPWWSAAVAWSQENIRNCSCGVNADGTPRGFVRGRFEAGHQLFGKSIPCVCALDRFARSKAERLRALSGMSISDFNAYRFTTFGRDQAINGTRLADADFRAHLDHVVERCMAYAQRPTDGFMILVGPYGAGKTHLAKAIVNAWMGGGGEVYFSTVPDLLDTLREGYDVERGGVAPSFEQRLEWFRTVALLVLDDLGAHRATDWAAEKLFQIINDRYEARRATVITSNQDVRESSGGIEPRIASRLADARHDYLVLPCGDYRRGVR